MFHLLVGEVPCTVNMALYLARSRWQLQRGIAF